MTSVGELGQGAGTEEALAESEKSTAILGSNLLVVISLK